MGVDIAENKRVVEEEGTDGGGEIRRAGSVRRDINVGDDEFDVGNRCLDEDGFGDGVVGRRRQAYIRELMMDERDETASATGRAITPDNGMSGKTRHTAFIVQMRLLKTSHFDLV